MRVKIHFDSYVMVGDTVIFEAATMERIREMFILWLESRGMDTDQKSCGAWAEILEDER